ncbi:MAG: hypothetical protein OEZ22_12065 [Spirochaetia bacterium]|nr:hypothetical protein [Spirochaetia bacterium]
MKNRNYMKFLSLFSILTHGYGSTLLTTGSRGLHKYIFLVFSVFFLVFSLSNNLLAKPAVDPSKRSIYNWYPNNKKEMTFRFKGHTERLIKQVDVSISEAEDLWEDINDDIEELQSLDLKEDKNEVKNLIKRIQQNSNKLLRNYNRHVLRQKKNDERWAQKKELIIEKFEKRVNILEEKSETFSAREITLLNKIKSNVISLNKTEYTQNENKEFKNILKEINENIKPLWRYLKDSDEDIARDISAKKKVKQKR